MQLPIRIRTGYRNRTIPNPNRVPAWTYQAPKDEFQGKVEKYDFRRQVANYTALAALLKKHDVKFTKITGLTSEGDIGRNHRFIALTDNPGILWYKYVGYAAQSGQNHVYLHGRRVKVSVLLKANAKLQKALITNSVPSLLRLEVARVDESGTLWS